MNSETPLADLLALMRDESLPDSIRLEAAKLAAPFFHPLASPAQPEGEDA